MDIGWRWEGEGSDIGRVSLPDTSRMPWLPFALFEVPRNGGTFVIGASLRVDRSPLSGDGRNMTFGKDTSAHRAWHQEQVLTRFKKTLRDDQARKTVLYETLTMIL